jgi:predicted AAA+ superfamily ATPase
MLTMIARRSHVANILKRLRDFPVVALLGARQIGKTTLAGLVAKKHGRTVHRFDLEDPTDLARLDDPMLALANLRGLVILDEVQRRPNLFPILRVLADRKPKPARFLVLGSASPDLLRQSSETLAGRISYYELPGLALSEVGINKIQQLWLRGGFPSSFLARTNATSNQWRRSFVQTFLERDIPQLGIRIPATTLRRFWTMLAHWHAQTWNASEFGRSFGVSDNTVRNYLDILTSALVVRQLRPWHANISKRQVKSPKVYLRDSGLLHALLQIESSTELQRHPKVGASWEGFILEQLITHLDADSEQTYFWGTHGGAELDLYIPRGRKGIGFEIKRTTTPKLTASIHAAMDALAVREIVVIHAGDDTYALGKNVRAVSANRLTDDL